MENRTRMFARSVALATVLPLAMAGCAMLESDPQSQAEAAVARNDHNAARLHLAAHLREAPGDIVARLDYARAHLGLGDGIGAEAALQDLPATDRDSAAAAALMAEAKLLQNDADAALEWAKKAGTDTPEGAWANIGAQLATGAEESAYALAVQAVAAHPRNARLLALRGEMALQQRSVDTAGLLATRAVKADPNSLPARMLAGKVALLAEDYAGAQAHFAHGAETNPGVITPLLSLAATQADRGLLDEASKTMDAVRDIAPSHPMAQFIGAKLAFESGDLDLAHTTLQQGESALRKVPAAQLLMGEVAYLRGSHEQAIAFLRPFMRDNPLHVQGATVMAQAMMAVGEPARALRTVKAPAGRASASPQLIALASKLAKQAGEPDPYAKRLAGTRVPPDFGERAGTAERAIAQGEWKKADAIYTGLLKDGMGTNALVLNNAAHAALRSGRKPAANALARRALALVPDDPDVLDTAGWVLLNTGGNPAEALALLTRAKDGAPGNLQIRWHYADALARNGRRAEARRVAKSVRAFAGPAQQKHIDALLARI
ncbi:MAG: tetratricopeptide repeat protein [Parerythrobacter sp.]